MKDRAFNKKSGSLELTSVNKRLDVNTRLDGLLLKRTYLKSTSILFQRKTRQNGGHKFHPILGLAG